MGQQVVIVEQATFAFIVPVIFFNLTEVVEFGKQIRKLRVKHFRHAGGLIGRQADDLGNRLFTREAANFFVQSKAGADQIDRILGVGPVQNREGIGKPEQGGVASQDGIGKRMKRPAGHLITAAAHEGLGALNHFFRGASGERQEEQRRRVNAFFNHPRDPKYQGPRLATPGSGQYQNRTVARGRGLVLTGVQLLLVVDRKPPRTVVFRI